MVFKRFVAEERDEDFPNEHCVIDEHLGPVGGIAVAGLYRQQAIEVAEALNRVWEESSGSAN